MSKMLSLKMQNDIFIETEAITKKIHMPRNAYINQAVDFYNKLKRRALLKRELSMDSHKVRENSMDVLSIYDQFEDEIAEG